MSVLACMFGFHKKITNRSYEQIYASHNGKFLCEKILETELCEYCKKKFSTNHVDTTKTPHNGVYNF